jgi:hypothetical protein
MPNAPYNWQKKKINSQPEDFSFSRRSNIKATIRTSDGGPCMEGGSCMGVATKSQNMERSVE